MFDIDQLGARWERLLPGMDKIGIRCNPKYGNLRFFQLKSINLNKVFMIQIDNVEDFDIDDVPKFELLKISYLISHNKLNIMCELMNSDYSEVFDYQIHHLINNLCSLDNADEIILKAKELINIWATYLLVEHNDGMSEFKQRGLYGELWFLKNKIMELISPEEALNGYAGSNGNQDFQYKDNLYELKSSISNNPKKINIANEKQLNVPESMNLNLIFVSMDKYKNNGQSLHNIVMELKTLFILETNLECVTKFDNLLLEYGYPLPKTESYDEYGYEVREMHIFDVKDDFPRIKESDLKNGIGSVNYSIDLSSCFPYKITEDDSFKGLL